MFRPPHIISNTNTLSGMRHSFKHFVADQVLQFLFWKIGTHSSLQKASRSIRSLGRLACMALLRTIHRFSKFRSGDGEGHAKPSACTFPGSPLWILRRMKDHHPAAEAILFILTVFTQCDSCFHNLLVFNGATSCHTTSKHKWSHPCA